MGVRVWGVVEDRLIEILAEPAGGPEGAWIEGLPGARTVSTRDRVRSALINQGLLPDLPPLVIRLEPFVRGPGTSDLDLPIALAVLLDARVIGPEVRWILAFGRLGLDGTVHAAGVSERMTLADVVDSVCRIRGVESERMFERDET